MKVNIQIMFRKYLMWIMRLVLTQLVFWSMPVIAQENNVLQDIEVQTLPDQRIELRLILTKPAPDPLSFSIEDPARIALDLPGTTLGLSLRRRNINLGPLDTFLTAE